MIFLVDAGGAISLVSPPDFALPGVPEYAAGCTWCWSLAHAWELARKRRRR